MNKIKVNYPGLYLSSDNVANRAQKRFVHLNRFTLITLILGALLGAVSFKNNIIPLISGILLLISMGLTIILMVIKFEKGWYEGRAIAESVKTLSWKFMMRSDPFDTDLNDKEAEERLINNFKELIGQRKEYFNLIGKDFAKHEHVTSQMREIRNEDVSERLSTYSKSRLKEQKEWYSDKALENKKNRNVTFGVIITLQLFAIGGLVINQQFEINILLTPVLITIASSLIAWMQLKRYQELSQSYSITATELSMIQNKVHHIKTQDDLSEFVDDAERAISREHTLWLARRDNIDLFR